MRRIQAVVFDFGGPVLKTPFEMLTYFEQQRALPAGSIRWRGPFDPPSDDLWRAMQTGLVSERAYWQQRAEQLAPYTGGARLVDLFDALFDAPAALLVRPEAEEFLARCQASGLRTAILTNDLRTFHGPDWIGRIAFLGAVDCVVDGSVSGYLKPDRRAYQTVLDELGVAAENTVFIDDQPANIAGAERAGLQPVWFDVRAPADSYRRAAAAAGLAQPPRTR